MLGRQLRSLKLDRVACAGLREAVRPYSAQPYSINFCVRLYRCYYLLEADPDLEVAHLEMLPNDILLINQFLSAEDGNWAKEVLHQTRQALYELDTGKEAVRLASHEEVEKLLTSDPSLEGTEPTDSTSV